MPSVVKVIGGFQITRWLFVEDNHGKRVKESVQQVQEFVGDDGEYRRTILKTMAPPALPQTNLFIPKFE